MPMKTAMTHSKEKVPSTGSSRQAAQETRLMMPLMISQPPRLREPPAML